MNESIISFADVEDGILNYEVTDETVEAAHCSGLDTCPS